MDNQKLNTFSAHLVATFQKVNNVNESHEGIRVNKIVSEIATWYERIRNAMEYREDEVILRAAIERILKRRLILGGNGKTIAEPLIRELTWARYFPNGSIEEATTEKVAQTIDLYLKLRREALAKFNLREADLNTWFYQVISSHIENILNPHPEREAMINYMYHILKSNIEITDDSEETRDAQVFIAVRKAYAKNDMALLRFHLFTQFFGDLTTHTVDEVIENFKKGFDETERQLKYPLRFSIFSYVKRQTSPFLILDDILTKEKGNIEPLIKEADALAKEVAEACRKRYKDIIAKVRRAVIRSVIFILLSKALFAFLVEGTYENFFYGHVMWSSIALNIIIPPCLMIIVGLSIRTPDKKNTDRILARIKTVLFDSTPIIGNQVLLQHIPKKTKTVLEQVLTILWIAAFAMSFGIVIAILSRLHFNPISQFVFIFFLTIVTFLAYRINRTANLYTVGDRQGVLTPLIDLLFLPIAQVGRHLTDGISQINIFLFILDFVIEAPFKAIFGFFEQLFIFLHRKREYLD